MKRLPEVVGSIKLLDTAYPIARGFNTQDVHLELVIAFDTDKIVGRRLAEQRFAMQVRSHNTLAFFVFLTTSPAGLLSHFQKGINRFCQQDVNSVHTESNRSSQVKKACLASHVPTDTVPCLYNTQDEHGRTAKSIA